MEQLNLFYMNIVYHHIIYGTFTDDYYVYKPTHNFTKLVFYKGAKTENCLDEIILNTTIKK